MGLPVCFLRLIPPSASLSRLHVCGSPGWWQAGLSQPSPEHCRDSWHPFGSSVSSPNTWGSSVLLGRQGLRSAWCGGEVREAGEEGACAQHRGVGSAGCWGGTACIQRYLLLQTSQGGGCARLSCTAKACTPSLPSPSTSGAWAGGKAWEPFTIHQPMISSETSASQLRFCWLWVLRAEAKEKMKWRLLSSFLQYLL